MRGALVLVQLLLREALCGGPRRNLRQHIAWCLIIIPAVQTDAIAGLERKTLGSHVDFLDA